MNSQTKTQTAQQYQVFLIYARGDREVARQIFQKIEAEQISIYVNECELQSEDSIAKCLENTISAQDYLLVLVSSNSINSPWFQRELGEILSTDLTLRDITLLPVLVSDCQLPEFLWSHQFLDLRNNFDGGLNQLSEQIRMIPELDFSKLDAQDFEDLNQELLTDLGFEIVLDRSTVDCGYDFIAYYSHFDPFNVKISETWIVQLKFYSKQRASLHAIHELADCLSNSLSPAKGLLITNSHLTSAARQWLSLFDMKEKNLIRVVDGTELKRLLLQHKDIVVKYFTDKPVVAP